MSDKNPTDNHELPRPTPGSFEGSWGEDVMNDDLTAKLEERVPIVDVSDNRGNYEPYDDAAFLARDTGQVSIGDGESWEFVGVVADADSVIDAIDGAEITPESVTADSVSTDEGGIELLTEPERELKEPTPKRTYHPSVGRQIDSFGTFDEDWTVEEGVAEAETEIVYSGSQAVYMEDEDNYDQEISRTFSSPIDLSGDLSLAIYPLETYDEFDIGDHSLQIRVTAEDADGNERNWGQQVKEWFENSWLRLDLTYHSDDDAGFDPTAVEELTIRAGQASKPFIIDDLRVVPNPGKAYVSLLFDDNHTSHYETVYPALGDYGFKGCFFISGHWVGDEDRMDWEDTDEIYDAGHDIGNHGATHAAYYELDEEEQREEMADMRRQLLDRGYYRSASIHNSPGGDWDATTLDLMDELVTISYEGGWQLGQNPIATEPRLIRGNGGDDFVEAQEKVDTAVERNRYLNLVIHDVDDESGFRDLLEHIKEYEESGDLEVIRPSDYLNEDLLEKSATRGESSSNGGGGGERDHLETIVLSDSAESITIDLSGHDHDRYYLSLFGRFRAVEDDTDLYMQINGNSDSRYDYRLATSDTPVEESDMILLTDTLRDSSGQTMTGDLTLTAGDQSRVRVFADIDNGYVIDDDVLDVGQHRDIDDGIDSVEIFTDPSESINIRHGAGIRVDGMHL